MGPCKRGVSTICGPQLSEIACPDAMQSRPVHVGVSLSPAPSLVDCSLPPCLHFSPCHSFPSFIPCAVHTFCCCTLCQEMPKGVRKKGVKDETPARDVRGNVGSDKYLVRWQRHVVSAEIRTIKVLRQVKYPSSTHLPQMPIEHRLSKCPGYRHHVC